MGFVITIGRVTRELEPCVINGARYPYLRVVGDKELITESVRLMTPLLPAEAEVLLAPEFGGAIVAHQLAITSGLPYVVARKKKTPIFGSGITAPVKSAASGKAGCLYLAERDARVIRGRAVLLVDEVVCGGGTMNALESIADSAGARAVGRMGIATQGSQRSDVIALLHLPQLDW